MWPCAVPLQQSFPVHVDMHVNVTLLAVSLTLLRAGGDPGQMW